MTNKYISIINDLAPELEIKQNRFDTIQKEAQKLSAEIDELKNVITNLYLLAKVDEDTLNIKESAQINLKKDNIASVENKKISSLEYDKMDFDDIIVEILKKEDRPMTSSEIMDTYNKLVSKDKNKNRGSFSGMISQKVKKTNKYVRIDNKNLVGRAKQVFGLPYMFENENIKEEYIDKLKTETNLFG